MKDSLKGDYFINEVAELTIKTDDKKNVLIETNGGIESYHKMKLLYDELADKAMLDVHINNMSGEKNIELLKENMSICKGGNDKTKGGKIWGSG